MAKAARRGRPAQKRSARNVGAPDVKEDGMALESSFERINLRREAFGIVMNLHAGKSIPLDQLIKEAYEIYHFYRGIITVPLVKPEPLPTLANYNPEAKLEKILTQSDANHKSKFEEINM